MNKRWTPRIRAGGLEIFGYRLRSIHRYRKHLAVDKAKGRRWPHLRGTWLPSIDWQINFGFALNWLRLRIRISLSKAPVIL